MGNGKVNWSRVVLGGLVAGLVINVGEFVLNEPILGRQWAEAMEALNQSPPGGSSIAIFVVLSFLLGIASVYLYAAIRPRFGAGAKTAICAGLIVWFFAYFYASAGFLAMGLFPTSLVVIATLWGLVEIPLATLAGASMYKEA